MYSKGRYSPTWVPSLRPSRYTVARWLTDSKRRRWSPPVGTENEVRYQATVPRKLSAPAGPVSVFAFGENGSIARLPSKAPAW